MTASGGSLVVTEVPMDLVDLTTGGRPYLGLRIRLPRLNTADLASCAAVLTQVSVGIPPRREWYVNEGGLVFPVVGCVLKATMRQIVPLMLVIFSELFDRGQEGCVCWDRFTRSGDPIHPDRPECILPSLKK